MDSTLDKSIYEFIDKIVDYGLGEGYKYIMFSSGSWSFSCIFRETPSLASVDKVLEDIGIFHEVADDVFRDGIAKRVHKETSMYGLSFQNTGEDNDSFVHCSFA